MGRSFWVIVLFMSLVITSALGLSTVIAAVQTDQADYAPGSVVTISGDNSNDAGYLPGEAVSVAVNGPNGYESSCAATADANGAWSCQITLWDDDRAIGAYAYIASGLDSAVTEAGTFTDARNWTLAFAGTGAGSVVITVSTGTVNAPLSCGGTGSAAATQTVTSTCSPNITTSDNNAVVTLKAVPAAGSAFAGWSGQSALTASPAPGCTTTNNPCSVVLGSNATVTVTFNAPTATPTPSPSVTPTPTNTATSPATNTATSTSTSTNTATSTNTPTPAQTATPTPTFTSTATPTPTNVLPTADAGGPYSGNEGTPISLDASASSDSDGTIVSYAWDLDNDSAFDDAFTAVTNVTFPDNGVYAVSVQVTDQRGGTATDSAIVTVANLAPSIGSVLLSPSTLDEGGTSTVTVSADDVPADALAYAFDCDGDLTYEVGPQGTNSTVCSFPDGPHAGSVNVRVSDEDGGSSTGSAPVTVNNLDPVISAVEALPSSVNEGTGSVITLTATDIAADTADLRYSFDCDGDAVYDFTSQIDNFAGCSFPDGPATVSVGVRVEDQDGGEATGTAVVTVENLAPVIVSVGASPSTIDEGSSSTIAVSASDVPADVSDLRYSFDCDGDAVYDQGPQVLASADCLFPDGPAVVTVGVKVTDQDGGEATGSVDVTVLNVAPSVVVFGDFGDVNEGQSRTYTYSVTDPGADSVTVAEDCGPGAALVDTPAPSSFDCTFPNGPATTTVNVVADDGDPENNIGDSPHTITIVNVGPSVTAGAVSGDEGASTDESASFTDAGVLDTHTCSIDWGDGVTNAGSVTESNGSGTCSGSHIYADNGSYTVTVTVTDNDGGMGSDDGTATIANVAPSVTAGAVSGDEGASASESASFADAGALDTHTCSIAWGDGVIDAGSVTESNGSGTCSGSHIYADNGSYTVTVIVTDNDGGMGSDDDTATIANVAPNVTAGAVSGDEGASASETASFTDAGVLDTHTCSIDWGDGATTAGSVTESNGSGTCAGSHTYADNGSYTVAVTVTDNDNGPGSDNDTATIANVAPNVTAGAVSGDEGASTSESASFTDAGVLDTHTCSIDWGDGATTAGTVNESNGSGTCSGSHTYADNGSYNVTVTVTDNDGDTGSDDGTATIANLASNVTAGAVTGNEGASVGETSTFTDAGVLDTHTCSIAWGDGVNSAGSVTESSGSGTCSGSHTYADNGTYTITVTVTDNDGGAGSDDETAAIENVAPTATLGNGGPVLEGGAVTVTFSAASDPSSADTGAGFHYRFACDNSSLSSATYAEAGAAASTTCTYPDEGSGSYPVRARIIDKDGGFTEYTTVVTVNNALPSVTAGAVNGDEGASVSESTSFTDAGVLDTHTCSIAWGDGATTVGAVTEASGSGTCSGSHVYADNGSYALTVTVTDNDGAAASDIDTGTIGNVAPGVNAGADKSVTWTPGGATVALAPSPTFTDPGADTHTCTLTWGDGSASVAGSVGESLGNPTTGTCGSSHGYLLPGVFTATVRICDDDGACAQDSLVVSVGLTFYGFLQPLNDPAISTNTPSVWKAGSNIPLKFQLRDANGAAIPDSLAQSIAASCATVSIAKFLPGNAPPVWAIETETSSSPTADGGVCFRYEGGQFMYNLKTKTPFYTVLPDTYKATATVTYNGGVIASHTQANTFGLR